MLAPWLSRQTRPPLSSVSGLSGLFRAVDAAAAIGRAVAAYLKPAGLAGQDSASTAHGQLAAARLARHDFVDFVVCESREPPELNFPATVIGSTLVLAECADEVEAAACVAAAADTAELDNSDVLPPCCLGVVGAEALREAGGGEASSESAVRWLSDWLYDHDVPMVGQITDRNAPR